MRVRIPHSRSRSWSVSVWTKSVGFVVAALCLAFTEGQAPPVWQTGTTDDVLKAAGDLAGPHLAQATALDHAPSVRTDGSSGSLDQGRAAPGLLCGICQDLDDVNAHIAVPLASPFANFGPGVHGWHNWAPR